MVIIAGDPEWLHASYLRWAKYTTSVYPRTLKPRLIECGWVLEMRLTVFREGFEYTENDVLGHENSLRSLYTIPCDLHAVVRCLEVKLNVGSHW